MCGNLWIIAEGQLGWKHITDPLYNGHNKFNSNVPPETTVFFPITPADATVNKLSDSNDFFITNIMFLPDDCFIVKYFSLSRFLDK